MPGLQDGSEDFSNPAASQGEEILAVNNVKVSLKYKWHLVVFRAQKLS